MYSLVYTGLQFSQVSVETGVTVIHVSIKTWFENVHGEVYSIQHYVRKIVK